MTFQRPAYEQMRIEHNGHVVVLRPSLRAAATLEARHGFPALVRALDELNVTIISEIIAASAISRRDAAAFLSSHPGRPLFSFFLAVRQPLADLISMFTPTPVQQVDATPHTGKPLPWADFYRDLYDVATGWLGWTPETAWSATPTEITRAHAAHIDRLVMTGVLTRSDKPTSKAPDPEQAARNEAEGLDPEFDRAGLRALKAKIAGGTA